jgi:DNA modification methylase
MLSEHSISRLRRIDWDFPGTASESPFSAIHWHPARLPSQIAATLIGVLTEPYDLVLDPFLGSGTCGVEAQRLNRRFVGIDLNPVSCLIAKAKTLNIPAPRIGKLIELLQHDAKIAIQGRLGLPRSFPASPATVQNKWYTPRAYRDLCLLWEGISGYRDPKRTLARAAFSAILLPVCRETRHWGYVCDNSTPKGDHDADVLAEYRRILYRLACAYQERDDDRSARTGSGDKVLPADIRCGDSRELLETLAPQSVDLVLTSPPYFGVSDYIKSQRLSSEWLEIQIEPLRQTEIGARSKRHRMAASEDYVSELRVVFSLLRRCLKPKGAFAIVIGESSSRQPLLEDLIRCLKSTGFNIDLKLERTVSPQRRQHARVTTETLLVSSARRGSHGHPARPRRTSDSVQYPAEVLFTGG